LFTSLILDIKLWMLVKIGIFTLIKFNYYSGNKIEFLSDVETLGWGYLGWWTFVKLIPGKHCYLILNVYHIHTNIYIWCIFFILCPNILIIVVFLLKMYVRSLQCFQSFCTKQVYAWYNSKLFNHFLHKLILD